MRERIDQLARLRSVFVTLTGGESLLHPRAAELVAYVRERGMVPFLNTNGYLLTRAWIDALNAADLYALQISVDSVTACSARARRRRRSRSRAPSYLGDDFTRPLLDSGELVWKCRAGARTFHVDEHGLVHLCAPRTGTPAKPLALYSEDDIRTYFTAPKPCAATCPVAYAHHVRRLDRFRSQRGAAIAGPGLVQIRRAA